MGGPGAGRRLLHGAVDRRLRVDNRRRARVRRHDRVRRPGVAQTWRRDRLSARSRRRPPGAPRRARRSARTPLAAGGVRAAFEERPVVVQPAEAGSSTKATATLAPSCASSKTPGTSSRQGVSRPAADHLVPADGRGARRCSHTSTRWPASSATPAADHPGGSHATADGVVRVSCGLFRSAPSRPRRPRSSNR